MSDDDEGPTAGRPVSETRPARARALDAAVHAKLADLCRRKSAGIVMKLDEIPTKAASQRGEFYYRLGFNESALVALLMKRRQLNCTTTNRSTSLVLS